MQPLFFEAHFGASYLNSGHIDQPFLLVQEAQIMAALCVDPSDSKLTRYAHDENRAYKEKTPQVNDLRGWILVGDTWIEHVTPAV